MKLLISFNMLSIEKALSVASVIEPYVSTFIISPLLLYTYGVHAVARFNDAFPEKSLMVDSQIIERPQESVTIFAQAGAEWVSLLGSAHAQTIQQASTTARTYSSKIIINLAGANSVGQAALDASRLGAEALLFHKPTVEDSRVPFLEQWQMAQGNTSLPIYLSAHASRETIGELIGLNPAGIILGSTIVNASEPEKEIAYFANLLKN